MDIAIKVPLMIRHNYGGMLVSLACQDDKIIYRDVFKIKSTWQDNYYAKLTLNFQLIDWLLEFYAQAAIFQLYSGDKHEIDDKMNMKWWWHEKWNGTQG